jgi:hypothetical protein
MKAIEFLQDLGGFGSVSLERASYNGSIEASQASDVGSIPIARSRFSFSEPYPAKHSEESSMQPGSNSYPMKIDTDHPLLTECERGILSEPYRHHIAGRRHNWNINIATFRPLWDCFMLLNEIWSREIEGLAKQIANPKEVFPYSLLGAAHTKVHVVIDLCFSDYVLEALSILRDGIENVVHACRLLSRPELVEVWLSRENDAVSQKAWEEEFWFDKESRLFEGLPELHRAWKMCSDISHANAKSLLQRYYLAEGNEDDYALHYTDGSADSFPLMLSGILQVLTDLEQRAFDKTKSNLEFDAELLKMRDKLRRDKWNAFERLGLIFQLSDGSFFVSPETVARIPTQPRRGDTQPLETDKFERG